MNKAYDAIDALPFTEFAEHGWRWWSIPRQGEYFGGCKVGNAAALAYLKYLRDADMGHLQHIAFEWIGDECDESLKGQVVGFCTALDQVLRQAVCFLPKLEQTSLETLAKEIADGLAMTDERVRRKAEARERSEAAKRGWETRRARQGSATA